MIFLFADEAGNFDFSLKGTRYFIADYCAWAIQRWKERDDDRSWVLIKDKVSSLYEPFASLTKLYY
jgi:hypothetical protein